MKKILLILVIAIFANVVYSQQAAPEQIYQMNEDALKMVLEYKAQASMNKPRRFVRLFENEDIQIYNDLLGLSTEKTLSVKDYATLMEKEALYPTIKIQNLKKESIYRKNGKWMMDLSFEKELTYTDKCGVLFSTEEYYGQYHIITMTLAWNNDLKTCLIAKLEGKNNSRVGELNNYKVIVSSSNEKDKKRENNVLVNGKHLKFNSFGQYIISANAELVYEKDQDMKFELVQNESGCEIYSIKYDPMSMRIKPHYNLGAIMPYGKYFESGLLMSRAVYNEVGIDFGYVIPSMNRFQLGVYFGLGYAASGMRFSIDSLDFHYNAGAEADIDGVQEDVANLQAGTGLADGTSAPVYTGSNYLGSASTMVAADMALDAKIKEVADSVVSKNVSAEGDTYVTATAANNKVTVAAVTGTVESKSGLATNQGVFDALCWVEFE
jgi:hypothetical protein